ncbi:hypothetical protein TIFTF001_020259 [Ficus carica]|uniref:Uncharacterized protein n=1 Tax=Ficus carica TaxID=3494 RepID=A0AA88ARE5_FICCA|nr:hypothetical protein TIFTF001_020259 [Ficus carica]
MQAWEMYKNNKLTDLVDSSITSSIYSANFSSEGEEEEEEEDEDREGEEEEVVLFLKVGLLCVQENSTLRPSMSIAIRMMTNDMNIDDVQVSKPGHINNIMDVKIGKRSSRSSQLSTSNMQIPQIANHFH